MKRLDTKSYDCTAGCPVEATLDLIDGKWKAVILYHLIGDTIRFNELGRRLSRITQRMLTRQLIGQMRGRNRFQYYEPMHLFTPQPADQPYRILFDESQRKLFRVDPFYLRNIELCFGVFSAKKFARRPGDFRRAFAPRRLGAGRRHAVRLRPALFQRAIA